MVLSIMDQHSAGSCAMTARLPEAPPVRFSLWNLSPCMFTQTASGMPRTTSPRLFLGSRWSGMA